MSPEQFSSMVEAWYQVYAPIAQAGVIGMVVAAIFLGVIIFIALLLRNQIKFSFRFPFT